jgi:hypothetical protein
MFKQGFIWCVKCCTFQQGSIWCVKTVLEWLKADRHCYAQHTVMIAEQSADPLVVSFKTVKATDVAYCEQNLNQFEWIHAS